jgi:hypothetical protein
MRISVANLSAIGLLSLLIASISCKSNSTSSGDPANDTTHTQTDTTTYFSYTLNGVPHQSKEYHSRYDALQNVTDINCVEGVNATILRRRFQLGSRSIGEYDSVLAGYNVNLGRIYVAETGTITITNWTETHIAGTFDFVAVRTYFEPDTARITDGKFSLNIVPM